MNQCDRYMATGGQCELVQGHDGKHQKTYDTAVYRWTDAQMKRFVDAESRKKLGT